jgi:hypothetical protein
MRGSILFGRTRFHALRSLDSGHPQNSIEKHGAARGAFLFAAFTLGTLFATALPVATADAATAVTLYVSASGSVTTGCATSGAACETIQEGITAAEALANSDVTVDVAAGTYTENDSINVPAGDTLTLLGSSGSPIVNGGSAGSVFDVSGGSTSIIGLTITNGSATTGGGIDNDAGTLTLTGDTISGNVASANGGGVYTETGGSTTLANDTMFNDSATSGGGGIFNAGGTVSLTNDTLSGNSAASGGGIDNSSGATSISNSILVNSTCTGTVVDGEYNVESDNTCGFGSSDVVSSTGVNLATSLADNGSTGPETLALGSNSSAFKEVPIANCSIATDERGDPRPGDAGANCDAGAFENQVTPAALSLIGLPVTGNNTFVVTLTVPSGAPAPSETADIYDSATHACSASLSQSSATTYIGSCTLDGELAGETVVALYDADGGDVNYAATASSSLTVLAGTQAITFTSTLPSSPIVGQTYTVAATGGNSMNPVTFSIDGSSTSGACTISGATVSFVTLGTCVIDANQAGNTSYAAAPQSSQSVYILTLGTQKIVFTSLVPASPDVGTTYGVTATGGSSPNPVTFTINASSTVGSCAISAGTVTFLAAGSCVIDANQAATSNYLAAAQVQQTITVLEIGVTIVTISGGPRIVILQNKLSSSGASFRETVKLACRTATCGGQVRSIGQISITREVSVKSGPWTVTKKVTKLTKVVFSTVSYRLAAGKSEVLNLPVSAGGRSILAQAKTSTPVRETLTATVASGNTATSNDIVR